MKKYINYYEPIKLQFIPYEKKVLIAIPYLFSISITGGNNITFMFFIIMQYIILFPIALITDILIFAFKGIIIGWYDKKQNYHKSLLLIILWAVFYKFLFELVIAKIFGKAISWAAVILVLVASSFGLYFLIKSGLWVDLYIWLENLSKK